MDLQELADRMAITDVINRYSRYVTERDFDKMVALFTDDAVFAGGGHGPDYTGIEEIRAMYAASMRPEPGAKPLMPFDVHVVSQPLMVNVIIDLHGDTADVESGCVAVHAGTRGENGVVIMRGLVNEDKFRKTDGVWQISHRVHKKFWSVEVPGDAWPAH